MLLKWNYIQQARPQRKSQEMSVGQGSVVSRRQLGLRSVVSRRQLGLRIISGMMKESWVGGRELIHEWVNKKRQDNGGWGRERHKGWVGKKRNSKVRDVKGQESTFRTGMGPGMAYKGPESYSSSAAGRNSEIQCQTCVSFLLCTSTHSASTSSLS